MKKITFYLLLVFGWLGIQNFYAQFTENFDTQTPGSAPSGWTSYTTQNDDPGFVVVQDAGIARSQENFLAHMGEDIAQESTSWIVSPPIVVGSSQELVFYWREKWSYAYNYSGVFISSGSNDPIQNPGDFTELAEFDPAVYTTWNQWNEAAFDLSSFDGQTVYIAFKYTGDHAHDFYVDDFTVQNMPYCNPPQNVSIDAYTQTTLDVSWDGISGVDDYEIVWGPQGFDPTTATPTQVTGTSYQITGLNPATYYDVYVRTMCRTYNLSAWAGPATGRTAGPPPANDDCANAINLTVYPVGGSAGNETPGDTFDATPSSMAQTSCDNTGTNLDVFYSFTAPSGGSVDILTGGANGAYIEAAIYDACNGNELYCFGTGTHKRAGGLTPGQTYILQLWHDDFNKGEFTVALEETPPPPPNDDCSNAENLTVYPAGGGAGNETNASTTSATPSSMAHTSCDSFGTNLDVFYSFTAPANGSVKIITGGANGSSIEAAIYDACNGNEINCFGNSSVKLATGLTPGQTYILQVWHDDFNAGDFTIVLEEGPSGPPNDDCSNAENLTVYPAGGGAGNETNASTLAATQSSMGHTSCDSFGTNLDLFYSFTAPSNGSVKIITGGASGSSIEAAIYDACNGNEINCFGNSSVKLASGLTPGQTYILQVWHDDFNAGDFTIVLEEGPNPPANDVCSGAIALSVSASCNPVTADNSAASDSGVPSPGCASYNGGDLWFSAVVPQDGNLTIETSSVSGSGVSDTGMAVYSGDCSNLTLIECNDDGGVGLFSKVDLTGRTPGETVYIRVWEYGNNAYGEIGVCAYNPNVGIEDLEAQGFGFFPNPTNGEITFRADKDITKIEITTLAGQIIYTAENINKEGRINITQLPKGIYLMNVYMNDVKGTYKLIKE